MRIEELKEKLNELKVPKEWYSINEGLKFDAYILNKVYYYWEYFYFDERGGQNEYRKFDNESDACMFFFNKLDKEMKFFHLK